MQRISKIIFAFALLYTILIVAPGLLSGEFGPYSLMKNGDVLDLVTALVIIPLYWLMFQLRPDLVPRPGEMLIFLALAAAWSVGQGMHLAANSIGHLLKEMTETDVYRLTDFYDETLSHYIWHLAMIGLTVVILLRQWRQPFQEAFSAAGLIIMAAALHGLTYFLMVVEAQTWPVGIPAALGVSAFGLVWGRSKLRQQPVLLFFLIAYLLALVLFTGWAIYWGGLPELSEVGIIE